MVNSVVLYSGDSGYVFSEEQNTVAICHSHESYQTMTQLLCENPGDPDIVQNLRTMIVRVHECGKVIDKGSDHEKIRKYCIREGKADFELTQMLQLHLRLILMEQKIQKPQGCCVLQ